MPIAEPLARACSGKISGTCGSKVSRNLSGADSVGRLTYVNPRYAIGRCAKDEHVGEEEGNGSGGGGFSKRLRVLIRLEVKAQQHTEHHHAYGEPQTAPHHWSSASHLVQSKGRYQRAEEEHSLDKAANEEGEIMA